MSQRSGKTLAVGMFLFLLLAHHDFWNWDDPSLVLGFLPVGLFHHALISLGSSVAALIAMRVAWPGHLEAWAADRSGDRPR